MPRCVLCAPSEEIIPAISNLSQLFPTYPSTFQPIPAPEPILNTHENHAFHHTLMLLITNNGTAAESSAVFMIWRMSSAPLLADCPQTS